VSIDGDFLCNRFSEQLVTLTVKKAIQILKIAYKHGISVRAYTHTHTHEGRSDSFFKICFGHYKIQQSYNVNT
jgi:hypothetical protein